MSFFIKTLKKNIYINIIIILLCLGMFIKTDYQNIKRYNEGYKYPSTTTTITVFFSIAPKEKVFEYPAAERLKNMLKREFKEISFSYRVKESPSISIFGFSINQFDTDKFEEICDYIVNYLVENRSSFGKHDLISSDLRKFNPLYWKTEKGVRVENKGPTLYAKCVYNKKKETIDTLFMDELNRIRVNPLSIIGKHCYVQFALKIESIY